ncbi:hypothetical protein JHK85_040946 [Glycine max]|nr:hypothetical protein JHK86_040359 [Glycine max]KAG4965971.1 hypothetical protein JHK85_040946 [Glycine max]
MVSIGVSNETLTVFGQQIDHSNHKMINTLMNHMASILNPLLRTTHEIYQYMNGVLTQIGDALAIPRNQPGNIHLIREIPVQERPINNNNNPENEVNIPASGFSRRTRELVHVLNNSKLISWLFEEEELLKVLGKHTITTRILHG